MRSKEFYLKLFFAALVLVLAMSACDGGGGGDEVVGATPTRPPTSNPKPSEPTPTVPGLVEARVIRIVDGDTINVLIDGDEYRLRYIGMDTPELNHPTRGTEPFGPAATEANRELVEGKTVLLEKDVSETDRFGRLLRYVYVDDLMVNEELLRQGMARVATFPPDVKYVDRFLDIQREAQEAGRGLWGSQSILTEPTLSAETASASMDEAWGYTYQQPDGNRLAPGRGAVPDVQPLDIALDGQPKWLVAAPMSAGSVWAVLTDGRVQAFHVVGRQAEPIPIAPTRLPPDAPPMLRVNDDVPSLITPPTAAASSLTHPVMLPAPGEPMAFIESSGDLVIWDGEEHARVAANALVDARLLMDESGRILLMTDPTPRYDHGVLGDGMEASSITVFETVPTPQVAGRIVLSSPAVVEGIAPIWADLTGDGKRDIIVTLSDAGQGAQIGVFNEAGEQLAAGPAIGRGYRWRHQLVVAPFGPNGELELVDVLTPHIGGVVEYYQFAGDRLEIVAQVPGYSSHTLGSRNLDMAAAGDFDGDGRIELLVPDQARANLGAIRRTPDGAEVVWTVPVGERISTNLATVTFQDDTLAVGVGHEGNGLRLWLL